jgi:hypothetical protein
LSEPKNIPIFLPKAMTGFEADVGMKGYAAAMTDGAE